MKKETGSIVGLLSFIVLSAFTGYLVFFVNTGYKKPLPEEITIEGNKLLSGDDYLVFTKLDNRKFAGFSQAVIKDRFEKHPYILRADVEQSKKNLKVNTLEKEIKALIIINSEPYLISGEYQLLPLFTNLHGLNLPLITNAKADKNTKMLSTLRDEDIEEAFRIIDALKELPNKEILGSLSEINLEPQHGLGYEGDIVLNFTDLKPAVIFGRGNEAQKAVSIGTLWNVMGKNDLKIDSSDYVDLRYAGNIYYGSLNKGGTVQ